MGDRIDSKVEDHRRDPDPHPRLKAELEARIAAVEEATGLGEGGSGVPPGQLEPFTDAPTTVSDGATASPGDSDDYARGDHQHALDLPDDIRALASVEGDGVMTRDANGTIIATQDPSVTGTVEAGTLRVVDQVGTGERVVVAGEDGTQRAEDKARWEIIADTLALRFWNLTASPDDFSVLDAAPNPAAGVRILITSTGRQYAWDATGRYVWWSDDDAETWTAHDFGSGFATNLRGRMVTKDGVETMLLVNDAQASGCAWATVATPPVRTTFTSPITGASPRIHACTAWDGEPLMCGQDTSNAPRLARYVGGAWEKVTIPNANPSDGTVYGACKTSGGAYLAAGYSTSPARTWVRRSTDFATWSDEIDAVTDASQAIAFAFVPGPDDMVVRMLLRTAANVRDIRVSSDDGLSWSLGLSVAPPGGEGFYDQETGLWIISGLGSDTRIWTSDDGLAWTEHTLAAAPGGVAQAPSFVTAVGRALLRLRPGADLVIEDHTGTGQRMQTAAADGTLTPVESVKWDADNGRLTTAGSPIAVSLRTAAASRPAAAPPNAGWLHEATDESRAITRSDGSSWNPLPFQLPWELKTAPFTAAPGGGYVIDASAEPVTATLPENPLLGANVWLGIADATYGVKVGRNGELLCGGTEDLDLESTGDGLLLVYYGSTKGWWPATAMTPSGEPIEPVESSASISPIVAAMIFG